MHTKFRDYEVIEKLIYLYFDAVCGADVSALKTLFHDDASMFGDLGGMILAGSPEPFFEDIASKPSMRKQGIDCRATLSHLEVTGRVATATLCVDNFYGEMSVKDHFHLLKDGSDWHIVCKTFTTV